MRCARDPGLGEMYALVRSEALLAQRLDRIAHQVCAHSPRAARKAHFLCTPGCNPNPVPVQGHCCGHDWLSGTRYPRSTAFCMLAGRPDPSVVGLCSESGLQGCA